MNNDKDVFVIKDEMDYKYAKKNNIKVIDISEWDLTGNDIQNLDIEGLGLVVPLDKCFKTYRGKMKLGDGTNTARPLFTMHDDFIDLRNSNFKGNLVTGNLDNVSYAGDTCTFLYNEDTFDNSFIETHKGYFLDKDAPQELKDFFYNPAIVIKRNSFEEDLFKFNNNREKKIYQEVLKRPVLTFEYYMTNYKYLHNKYLDRFDMSKEDKKLIKKVEKVGLDNLIDSYIDDYKSKTKIKK